METQEFIKVPSAKNNGFLHLFLNLLMLVVFILIIIGLAKLDCMTKPVVNANNIGEVIVSTLNNTPVPTEPTGWIALPIVLGFLFLFCYILHLAGFFIVQPNQSRVLTFFGKYDGTVKENGFMWMNPFYHKEKISLRASNMDVEPIKVNDKSGNPIMIGLVLVWKIADTYKACFEIDSDFTVTTTPNHSTAVKNFNSFVRVQSDAALRMVAGQSSASRSSLASRRQCRSSSRRSRSCSSAWTAGSRSRRASTSSSSAAVSPASPTAYSPRSSPSDKA